MAEKEMVAETKLESVGTQGQVVGQSQTKPDPKSTILKFGLISSLNVDAHLAEAELVMKRGEQALKEKKFAEARKVSHRMISPTSLFSLLVL